MVGNSVATGPAPVSPVSGHGDQSTLGHRPLRPPGHCDNGPGIVSSRESYSEYALFDCSKQCVCE